MTACSAFSSLGRGLLVAALSLFIFGCGFGFTENYCGISFKKPFGWVSNLDAEGALTISIAETESSFRIGKLVDATSHGVNREIEAKVNLFARAYPYNRTESIHILGHLVGEGVRIESSITPDLGHALVYYYFIPKNAKFGCFIEGGCSKDSNQWKDFQLIIGSMKS